MAKPKSRGGLLPLSLPLALTGEQWAFCQAEASRQGLRSGSEWLVSLVVQEMQAAGVLPVQPSGERHSLASASRHTSNICPQCRSSAGREYGWYGERRRWRCASCLHQWVEDAKYLRASEREALKAAALAMIAQGRRQVDVCKATGITAPTLSRWVKAAKKGQPSRTS